MILDGTADELSCGQASDWYTHTHTDTRTDTQTQAMTIPDGQNWPRVKMDKLCSATDILGPGLMDDVSALSVDGLQIYVWIVVHDVHYHTTKQMVKTSILGLSDAGHLRVLPFFEHLIVWIVCFKWSNHIFFILQCPIWLYGLLVGRFSISHHSFW